ncbi:hypothetical protein GOBAR_DD36351 [Gossypium barbadense]|nr:hypothetical protein GOBAR_DD36351 [Gossypium barbadense]
MSYGHRGRISNGLCKTTWQKSDSGNREHGRRGKIYCPVFPTSCTIVHVGARGLVGTTRILLSFQSSTLSIEERLSKIKL